mmetsp:Transcript_6758/g.18543  ORF Transcript_6758/g.18543 Transcript_6758/m.18543 type:complete len:595 (-) Transcript_6758:92-1876(-)
MEASAAQLVAVARSTPSPAEAVAALAASWARGAGTRAQAIPGVSHAVSSAVLQLQVAPDVDTGTALRGGDSSVAQSGPLTFGLVKRMQPANGVCIVTTDLGDANAIVHVRHAVSVVSPFSESQALAFQIRIDEQGHREACAPLWAYVGPTGTSAWGEHVGRVLSLSSDGSGSVDCSFARYMFGRDPLLSSAVVQQGQLREGDLLRFQIQLLDNGTPQVASTIWKESSDVLFVSPVVGRDAVPSIEPALSNATDQVANMGNTLDDGIDRPAVDYMAVPLAGAAATATAAAVGLGTDYAQAVTRLKAIERSDCGCEFWRAWYEAYGGKKEPALRSDQELRAFLAETDSANIACVEEARRSFGSSRRGGIAGNLAVIGTWSKSCTSMFQPNSPEHAQLIECVKAFQKRPGGHDLWKAFCERQGGGKRDPAARRIQDLTHFLAEVNSGGVAVETESVPMSRHARLVTQIKQGQRSSDSFKHCWWRYCAGLENARDLVDPAQHSLESLQAFMSKAFQGVTTHDDEHKALVQQVKQGQRSSEEFRGAWYTFCSKKGTQKNDPARHDKAFLHEFLANPLTQRARPNSAAISSIAPCRYRPY